MAVRCSGQGRYPQSPKCGIFRAFYITASMSFKATVVKPSKRSVCVSKEGQTALIAHHAANIEKLAEPVVAPVPLTKSDFPAKVARNEISVGEASNLLEFENKPTDALYCKVSEKGGMDCNACRLRSTATSGNAC